MRYTVISTLAVLILLTSLFIIGNTTDNALAGESLDGRTFSIEVTEYGGDSQPKDDVLIFKDGNFSSTDCKQYGFDEAIYESATKGGTILFEATTKSEKEGIIEWEGKVTGNNIAGNFMWTKQGQEPIFYTYKGSLKK